MNRKVWLASALCSHFQTFTTASWGGNSQGCAGLTLSEQQWSRGVLLFQFEVSACLHLSKDGP